MLPPDLQDDEWEVGLDRTPFWQPGALDGYSRRLRLTLNPGLIGSRAAIRIDTARNGHVSGYVITQRPDSHRHAITVKRHFVPTPEEMARLDALIAQAGIWTIYPEHWVLRETGNNVCIDGVPTVLERLSEEGYRYSEANAQCTAPSGFLKVAAEMIEIAGLGDIVPTWLY